MIETLEDLIYEHERDHGLMHDDVLYIPADCVGKFRDELTARDSLTNASSFNGYDVVIDPLISEPQILPQNISDLRPDQLLLSDPPQRLLHQVVAQAEQHRQPSRGLRDLFTLRVMLKVEDRWEELDEQKLERFDIRRLSPRASEPTDDEVNTVNMGMQKHTQVDFQQIIDEFVKAAHDVIGTTEEKPIYGQRRREYSFPNGDNFVQYTEERCGTLYIEYGPMLMRNHNDRISITN